MMSNKGFGDMDDIYFLDSWDICWSGSGKGWRIFNQDILQYNYNKLCILSKH